MAGRSGRKRAAGSALARRPVELPEAASKSTFVIIAAYNEQNVVGRVVGEVRESFPNVVVVDDGSADATAARAAEAGAYVLRHAVNRGQGAALQTGIVYALRLGAEVLVTFDADGQHEAADLPYLIEPIWSGRADFVLGSRFLAETADPAASRSRVPWSRTWLLRMGALFTWLASGVRLSDTHNGLRALSRRAALPLDLKLDRMAHASEIIDCVRRSGLAYVEVPVRVRYTKYSRSKGQRGSDAVRVLVDYLLGRLLQ